MLVERNFTAERPNQVWWFNHHRLLEPRNPRYTHRNDPDRERAYRFTTDRVEALPYAANRLMAQSSNALAAGARLLGRNLRSTPLLRLLASSADPALRRDALAALALLRENVADLAHPFLNDSSAQAELAAETILLLNLADNWEPSSLPSWVPLHAQLDGGAALREVMLAPQSGAQDRLTVAHATIHFGGPSTIQHDPRRGR